MAERRPRWPAPCEGACPRGQWGRIFSLPAGIAYYIGRLAADEPGAAFNIISKDKGFDPLVRHLRGLGIDCCRLPELPGRQGAAQYSIVTAITRRLSA